MAKERVRREALTPDSIGLENVGSEPTVVQPAELAKQHPDGERKFVLNEAGDYIGPPVAVAGGVVDVIQTQASQEAAVHAGEDLEVAAMVSAEQAGAELTGEARVAAERTAAEVVGAEIAAGLAGVSQDTKEQEGSKSSVVISLDLPCDVSIADEALGYLPRMLSVRLNGRQARTLKRLFNGLHGGGYRQHNRQHVDKQGQVLTWLLDQVAGKLEDQPLISQ